MTALPDCPDYECTCMVYVGWSLRQQFYRSVLCNVVREMLMTAPQHHMLTISDDDVDDD
jgi:hypothetical protein